MTAQCTPISLRGRLEAQREDDNSIDFRNETTAISVQRLLLPIVFRQRSDVRGLIQEHGKGKSFTEENFMPAKKKAAKKKKH